MLAALSWFAEEVRAVVVDVRGEIAGPAPLLAFEAEEDLATPIDDPARLGTIRHVEREAEARRRLITGSVDVDVRHSASLAKRTLHKWCARPLFVACAVRTTRHQ
jgi:hypothetical protein